MRVAAPARAGAVALAAALAAFACSKPASPPGEEPAVPDQKSEATSAATSEATDPRGEATAGTTDQAGLEARYRRDLELIARPRPPGSPHWQRVQDHCAASLEAAGFTVRRERYESGVNVIGEKRGATRPDEVVLLGAHYDSTEGCPGADDNASGVAGVLEAARRLGGESFARTLVLACWDEEERGMIGSEAHARALAARGIRPRIAVVLEMIGLSSSEPDSQGLPPGFELVYGPQVARLRENRMRGDFIAVVHDDRAGAVAAGIARHAERGGLPAIALQIPEAGKTSPMFRDLRRSDHSSFWDTGAPAIMVTDTANFRNPHYHCGGGPDAAADLDTRFALRVTGAVVGALRDELGPAE